MGLDTHRVSNKVSKITSRHLVPLDRAFPAHTLRIQANPQPPHGAAADFDLVRLVNGAEVGRDRWTLSLQFTFLETVDPELMIVNPMGLLITYLRGDRALVTG